MLECGVGLMIGAEIIWREIKKTGSRIIVTTLTESLGTFILVSLIFGIVFFFTGTPLYLALIFGGIALATAPAPSLSVVREYRTDGPVTKTLIPMAALDDIVGVVVFFTVISVVGAKASASALPLWAIMAAPILPLVIGALIGIPAGFTLKKERGKRTTLLILLFFIALCAGAGFLVNLFVLPEPVMNFMLIGMAFSAAFANILPENRLQSVLSSFSPF